MKRASIFFTAIIVAIIAAATAHALGTAAGTIIENRAVATYDLGAATNMTAYSTTTQTLVDEVIDVVVANSGATTTFILTLPASDQPLFFSVTNNGNGSEPYTLTVIQSTTDDFDPTTPGTIFIDDGDSVFNTTVDIQYAGSITLPADSTVNVWVAHDIPAAAGSIGDVAILDLLAEHMHSVPFSTTTPGYAYLTQGDGNSDAVLGASGGVDSASGAYEITLTDINIVKSAVVTNILGNSDPITGATVTYTIEVSVTGSGDISNLVLTDPIPVNTTYVPGSLSTAGLVSNTPSVIGTIVNVAYPGTINASDGIQSITFEVNID